jgi:hypothetical protein
MTGKPLGLTPPASKPDLSQGCQGGLPEANAMLLRQDLAQRLEEVASRPKLGLGRGSTKSL